MAIKPLKNLKTLLPSNTHLLGFGFLIGALSALNLYYLLLGIILVFFMRKHKLLKLSLLFILLGFLIVKTPRTLIKPNGYYRVLWVSEDKPFVYTIRSNSKKYHLKSNQEIEIGSVIMIETLPNLYDHARFTYGFDAHDYYKSQGINGYFNYVDFEVIKVEKSPYKVMDRLYTYVDSLPTNARYFVKSLVLGDYEFENKDTLSKLGISHLFVLSGLHIQILMTMCGYLFKPFKPKTRTVCYTVILGFYLFITKMPLSLLRAALQFLIYEYFVINDKKITRLDALSLTFMIMIILNPFYLKSIAFPLSFISSLFFILERPKPDFMSSVGTTIYIQLLILPFLSQIQSRMYPLALLFSPVIMRVFSYTLMPLAWVSLFRPIAELLEEGFKAIISLFEYINQDQIGFLIPRLSGILILIYMVLWLLIYLEESAKHKLLKGFFLIIFLYMIPSIRYVKPYDQVTFLDVGQGDTTIIESKHNGCVIVIDAYGDIKGYLRNNHIVNIDYLIISHGHEDHYLKMYDVLETANVSEIIISHYEQDIEALLVDSSHKIKRVRPSEKLTCNGIEMTILGPLKDYKNANNNSLVIKLKMNDFSFLFTGDIEETAEVDLVNKYKKELGSDFLKVPHHGSITSSSSRFINHVNPIYAFISSGNTYLHPHKTILTRYLDNGIYIYQTKHSNTITVRLKYYDRKYRIRVHKDG